MSSKLTNYVLDKDVRQIIYEFSEKETKQNLLLFGEWNISSSVIINNITNIIRKIHNQIKFNTSVRYLNPFEDVSYVNNNQLEAMLYLLQNPTFEHNLILLRNTYYKKNKSLYEYYNQFINKYQMLKLMNPLFNSSEIKNKT